MESRQELALELGADFVSDYMTYTNPCNGEIIKTRNSFSRNILESLKMKNGADVVFDAVGSPESIRQALDIVCFNGKIIQIGVTKNEVSLPIDLMMRKQVSIIVSRNSCNTFPEVINQLDSLKSKLAKIISHKFTLEDLPKQMPNLADRPKDLVKAVIKI